MRDVHLASNSSLSAGVTSLTGALLGGRHLVLIAFLYLSGYLRRVEAAKMFP
jgi:hypothetical protein